MLATLLPVMGPVMFCVLLGLVWRLLGWNYDTQMVTQLVMRIGAPCLVVSSLSKHPVSESVLEHMLLVSVVLIGAMLLVAAIVLRLLRQPLRTFLGPVVFPNAGNMGLPICLFALGEEGLTLALAVFMVMSLVHFTLGIALLSGKSVVREMLTNPIVYSLVAAVFMIYTDTSLPRWADNTVQLLGGFTIPLMLLTLGVSLASLRIQSFTKSVTFAVLRLGIGFGVGWSIATLFGLQGVARGVLILQASMPVAVFNYLLAMQYQREPQVVAGMVVVSTLLSFLWIPFLLVNVL